MSSGWNRFHKAGAVAAMVAATGLVGLVQPAVAEEAVEPVNKGRVSLDLGLDLSTHYFFRGFPQENQGLVAQPWAEVGFGLFEGEGTLTSIDLYVGTWNSLHSNKTLATDSPEAWYESDFYAGLSFGICNDFSVDFVYTAYMYPGYNIGTIEELGIILGYEVPEPLFGFLSLETSAGFYFETSNDGGGSGDNKYFEFGITPSMTVIESAKYPVTFSMPITLGVDMEEYYGNETYGFFDIGFVLSAPLAFISPDFGAWEAYVGVHYINVGTGARDGGAITRPEKSDFVYGTFGISMSY